MRNRCEDLVERFESDEDYLLTKTDINQMCTIAKNLYPDLAERIEAHLRFHGYVKMTDYFN